MPLSLLLPAGLAALGAVLLPLLIHLARRSEHRPTDFAALRWLRAQPRPRHRIRFDEIPLLVLRVLLLALLAILLARPVIEGWTDAGAHVLVAPGVTPEQARTRDVPADAHWHWLAPGFPSLDDAMPTTSDAQASLLREFDATLPAAAQLVVIVPERWGVLDAQSLQLSREVRWEIVESTESPVAAATPARSPHLLAYADDTHADGLRYLRAVQAAWQPQHATLEVRATAAAEPPPRDVTTIAWLVSTPLPEPLLDWLRDGGTLLLAHDAPMPDGITLLLRWRDDEGIALIEGANVGRGQLLRFTRALDAQAMPQLLDAAFPDTLRAALQPVAAPALASAAALAPTTGAPPPSPPATPLTAWLVVALALLFLLERWLAGAPRRWRPR